MSTNAANIRIATVFDNASAIKDVKAFAKDIASELKALEKQANTKGGGGLFSQVVDGLKTVGKTVVGVVSGAFEAVKGVISSIGFVGSILSGAFSAVAGIVGGIVTAAGSLVTGLISGFGQVLGAVTGVVTGLFGFIGSAIGKVLSGFGSIGLAINGIREVIGILSGPLKGAADLESTAIALKTLTGSGEAAAQVMNDLKKFAAETPFEFPELAISAKKLIAFGIDAKDVTTHLRRLGDVASLLGIPLNELSDIYGKLKVQGRVYGDDIKQLAGRGVPIISALAQHFGVLETNIKGMVESGKVGFKDVEAALAQLTSTGNFAGGMKAQSESLGGLFSTLSDNLNMMSIDLANTIVAPLKGLMTNAIAALDYIRPAFDNFLERIRKGIEYFQPAFDQMRNVATEAFFAIGEMTSSLWASFSQAWTDWGLPTTQDFRSTVVEALIAMEYGFIAWESVVDVAFATAELGAHSFMRILEEDGPKAFNYFKDVAFAIIKGLGKAFNILFRETFENAKDCMAQTMLVLSGNGDEAVLPSFTGLGVQLKNAMRETMEEVSGIALPKLLQPLEDDDRTRALKDRIESGKGELSGFDSFKQGRLDELMPDNRSILDIVGDAWNSSGMAGFVSSITQGLGGAAAATAPSAGLTGKVELAGGAELGTKEARDSLIRHQLRGFGGSSKDEDSKKTAKNTGDIVTGINKIAGSMEKFLQEAGGGLMNSLGLS